MAASSSKRPADLGEGDLERERESKQPRMATDGEEEDVDAEFNRLWEEQNEKMKEAVSEPLVVIERVLKEAKPEWSFNLVAELRELFQAVTEFCSSNQVDREMRPLALVHCMEQALYPNHVAILLDSAAMAWPTMTMRQIYECVRERHPMQQGWIPPSVSLLSSNRATDAPFTDRFMCALVVKVNALLNAPVREVEFRRGGRTYKTRLYAEGTSRLTFYLSTFNSNMMSSLEVNYLSSIFAHCGMAIRPDAQAELLAKVFSKESDDNVGLVAKLARECMRKVTVQDFVKCMAPHRIGKDFKEMIECALWEDFATFMALAKNDACLLTDLPVPMLFKVAPMLRPLVEDAKHVVLSNAMAQAAMHARAKLFMGLKESGGEIDPNRYVAWITGGVDVFVDEPLRAVLKKESQRETFVNVDDYETLATQEYTVYRRPRIVCNFLDKQSVVVPNAPKFLAFVKDHTKFLMDNRPGVITQEEADNLVSYFESVANK